MLSRVFSYVPSIPNLRAKREAEAAERVAKERDDLEIAQELEQWLGTNLGSKFHAFIRQDLEKAQNALAAIEPSNVEEVRTLQAKIFAIRSIESYIARTLHALKKAMAHAAAMEAGRQ